MIALGCDSAGFDLMQHVKSHLDGLGLEYISFDHVNKPNDYPLFADSVVSAIKSGQAERGILICGTGIGISIAANRHKGIRCALCHDVFSAKATRAHNDANILAMGGRVIASGLAIEIVSAFLSAGFSQEQRHVKRVEMLDEE